MHNTYIFRVQLVVRVLELDTRVPLDFAVVTEHDQFRLDGPLGVEENTQISAWALINFKR